MYEIRFCQADERDLLQQFIHDDWKEGHVLATHTPLLDWQHLDAENQRYNFVVAHHTQNHRFDAILGFIPTYQFDHRLSDEVHLWLAIWKVVSERTEVPALGLRLLEFLQASLRPASIGGIGISHDVARLFPRLGFTMGRLRHYYLANPSQAEFWICQNPCLADATEEGSTADDLRWLDDVPHLPEAAFCRVPPKSVQYVVNRYARHPVYRYRFLGLWRAADLIGLFIMRRIEINNSSCLRIVDLFGGDWGAVRLRRAFLHLLEADGAEYVDFLAFGFASELVANLGFLEVQGDTVVPNYFEPFEPRNVEIGFAYKTRREPYWIVNGDSDQDRPNLVRSSTI